MKHRDRNKHSQGDERRNALKNHPEHIVNNPAYQYSGRSTDNMGLNHPDSSVGGGLANSEFDDKNSAQGQDYNRAGNFRNQGENEQTANDKVNYHNARPIDKLSGKEGKTMVKNQAWHENGEIHHNEDEKNEINKAKMQGQQQGGNHGGGALKGGKFGNQTKTNTARAQQQDQDGDNLGRKGKK